MRDNMDDISNKKLFYFIIALAVMNVIVTCVSSTIIVERAANRVIQKLEKEYSPSPFGPGIDPDKVDLDKIKAQTKIEEEEPTKVSFTEKPSSQLDDWESQRGFSQ